MNCWICKLVTIDLFYYFHIFITSNLMARKVGLPIEKSAFRNMTEDYVTKASILHHKTSSIKGHEVCSRPLIHRIAMFIS